MAITFAFGTTNAFGLDTEAPALRKGDFTYYKLSAVAAERGGLVTWDAPRREVVLVVSGIEYRYAVDSKSLKKGDSVLALRSVPIIENGSVYASAVFLEQIQLVESISEATVDTYRFSDLLKLAIESNLTLKKTEADLERTDIVNESVADNAEIVIGQGNGLSDLSRRTATIGLHSSQIYLDIAKKELAAQKEAIEEKLRGEYEALLSDKKRLELLIESKRVSDMELKQYAIKKSLGVVSEMDYQAKLLSNKSLAENIKSQGVTIENDYVAISNTVNRALGKDYSIEDDIRFESKELPLNAKYQTAYAIDMSPAIYKLKKSIEMSKLGVDLYTYNAGGDPLSAKILDVKKAELMLADATAAYSKLVAGLAGQIEALQQNHNVLSNTLAKSKQDVTKAEASYRAGLITELEYRQALIAVQSAELNLYENAIKHMSAVRAFEKPWLAAQ